MKYAVLNVCESYCNFLCLRYDVFSVKSKARVLTHLAVCRLYAILRCSYVEAGVSVSASAVHQGKSYSSSRG